MANLVLREKARKMRKAGMSINNISAKIQKNKSTVSNWCRDIILNQKQKDFLIKKSKKSGSVKFIEINERRRKERMLKERKMEKIGIKDVKKISKRDLMIIGISLYWGEGYKNSSDECGITNSDPHMVYILMKWFREIYNISDDRFILRISINVSHKKREKELKKFWSKVTGLSQVQFTKTSFIKTKVSKIYNNSELYYGTLRIKIRKGTDLKRRILGSIKSFYKNDKIELIF